MQFTILLKTEKFQCNSEKLLKHEVQNNSSEIDLEYLKNSFKEILGRATTEVKNNRNSVKDNRNYCS